MSSLAFALSGPLSSGGAVTTTTGLRLPQFLAPGEGCESQEAGTSGHAALGSALFVAAGLGLALRSPSLHSRMASVARRPARAVALRAADEDLDLEAVARQAVGSVAAAALLAGSVPDPAAAYPIFAQANYKEPEEGTGKIVCANCHLGKKLTDVRMPQQVLPDTIFKVSIDIPLKYEKRRQPVASGEKGPVNVGAIAIFPEGFKLAPKNRLPKPLKKEMKGLAWAPYSKEKPNIFVAGPVPGEKYNKMVLPVLAPDPNKEKKIFFGKYTVNVGANRGRGQIYPEGNVSNNNQFFADITGKVTGIKGSKVTITAADGTEKTKDCLPGADIVVVMGEEVQNGDPLTTNPNVGGFGQDEKELQLQDMSRVYACCAIVTSIFFAQLAFVLKKKQFEKVQLAEGF